MRQPTTRERILAAAVELFGRQGYHGTSVGEIETAAGLVPRSGGLYKHFPSKAALLEAAIESPQRRGGGGRGRGRGRRRRGPARRACACWAGWRSTRSATTSRCCGS